jgi:hypothetical protein
VLVKIKKTYLRGIAVVQKIETRSSNTSRISPAVKARIGRDQVNDCSRLLFCSIENRCCGWKRTFISAEMVLPVSIRCCAKF